MSGRKNIAVFGIYPDQLTAEDAVESLKDTGFRSTDISVLFPDSQGTRAFAHEKHTKAPEGALTGGGSGAVIGGALGWLAGVGALAIPGMGPFIAAGPLMGMLGGIGVGTAIGGIAGALIGLGIPEYEARRYEGRIRRGGILLSVHCDDPDWAKRARNILTQSGGEDVAAAGEAPADYAASDRPERRAGTAPLLDRNV
ncbi:MAG: DUF3341 domain-containing protein [Bryobacteraceae bacterium]|nr:DUF3341 domain-containing protein [Bryobacteraceae bacterium]